MQKCSGQPHFQESGGAAEAERAVGRLRHPEQHGLRGLKQPGCCRLSGIMSTVTSARPEIQVCPRCLSKLLQLNTKRDI